MKLVNFLELTFNKKATLKFSDKLNKSKIHYCYLKMSKAPKNTFILRKVNTNSSNNNIKN